VLVPEAYEQLERTNQRLLRGCDEIIARYRLPCYTEGLGAKGCAVFASERLREYRDYLTKVDDDLSTLAWLHHMNHGIFMTPGSRRSGPSPLRTPTSTSGATYTRSRRSPAR
jgi:glutamate-1-semialdehyde 2,1-aminomutase